MATSSRASSVRALLAGLALASSAATQAAVPGMEPDHANPILPGYFADPSLITHEGRHYLYATLDPWGGETLGCWESVDFKNWTYRVLNWPTKKACTSPTSAPSMVWAPSVVRAADGTFRMFVSVGSEVWVGKAADPAGPWEDANGGKPLIPHEYKPGFHMIDAEAFVDTDGKAYLYWGSGMNWVNGKCWAVALKPDMVTFDGEPRDVTPENYFEGPFMVKHGNRYHLMYSSGKTTEDTYQVRVATGDTPFGPFKEAANSPVLSTDRENRVISPGHHAVFEEGGRHYILYHRHSIPFDPKFVGRQVCVDEMKFDAAGFIEKIKPTHDGPALIAKAPAAAWSAELTASSQRNENTTPVRSMDGNFATLWAASPDAADAWLQADLFETRSIKLVEIRFEYAWKACHCKIESSENGRDWKTIADYTDQPVSGSPVTVSANTRARFVRIIFPDLRRNGTPGVFEWRVK